MKVVPWFFLMFLTVNTTPIDPILSRKERSNFWTDILEKILDSIGKLLDNLANSIAKEVPNITVNYENVYVYYYTNLSIDIPVTNFSIKDGGNLDHVFDSNKESAIIVHGWLNNLSSSINIIVKDAILRTHDINVFVVDWPAESDDYFLSFGRVTTIGQYLGEFINSLNKKFKYPFSQIMMICHSLGAHICGVAGKNTLDTIKSIAGLDPAGPGFSEDVTYNRLTENDAKFVEIIHTSTTLLGIDFSIGTADFFPNGGHSQPGCNLTEDIIGSCSHSMAYIYYAESIINNGFTATKCDSYKSYEIDSCNEDDTAFMGGLHLDKRANGNYYLNTKLDTNTTIE